MGKKPCPASFILTGWRWHVNEPDIVHVTESSTRSNHQHFVIRLSILKKLLCKIVNLSRESRGLLCFPFSNCPVSLDRKSPREEPLAKMTARDCATGTLQVCSRWEDVQILAPDPCACRWQHVWLCKHGFSCQPLPGQYLGFLWFEWFPSKLSEELNFHVMGRPERHCARCCVLAVADSLQCDLFPQLTCLMPCASAP